MITSPLFTPIEGAFAILHNSGIYRQAKLFSRSGFIYAAFGSGFIRLTRSGTTATKVSVADLIIDWTPTYTALGWMEAPKEETAA